MMRIAIAATVVSMLALLGHLGYSAYPSTEAVRLRNSLLFQTADPAVGAWVPTARPADFLEETLAIPPTIATDAQRIVASGEGSHLSQARALVGHLLTRASKTETGPTSHRLDVARTYREIIQNGRGYCSDFVDAFVAMALAAELPVRTWAFSFDGFGGHGHIVAEVFDSGAGRWAMLDVFNNVMPIAVDSGEVLSVRDFLKVFEVRESAIQFVPIGPGRAGYPIDAKLREYYRRGIDQWYLWNGNNVVGRGKGNKLVSLLGAVSTPLGEVAAIAFSDFPTIVPRPTATNAAMIENMDRVRNRLVAVIVVLFILGIALVVELLMLWRQSGRPGEGKPA